MNPKKKNLPHSDISGPGIITYRKKCQTKVLILRLKSHFFPSPHWGCFVSESKHKNQNKGRNLITLFCEFLVGKIKQKGVLFLAKAAASFVSSFHVVIGCTWVSDYRVSSNIQETLKKPQTNWHCNVLANQISNPCCQSYSIAGTTIQNKGRTIKIPL